MKKYSDIIKEKQQQMIEEYSEKIDILGNPFGNCLQSKTIDWIIEQLDDLQEKQKNEK